MRFDVAQPTSITMTSHPTHAKSPWTSKVNSFLYVSLNTLPLDGILLDHRPCCIHRFDMVDTEMRGDANEAQDPKPSKAYTWKRRKKRRRDYCGASLDGLQPGLGRQGSRRSRPPSRGSPPSARPQPGQAGLPGAAPCIPSHLPPL